MKNNAKNNFTKLDMHVIAKVKEMREVRGISQPTLSQEAGFNDAFIGRALVKPLANLEQKLHNYYYP